MKLYKQITCIALFCSAAFSLGAQSTHMELSLEDALSAARQNEIQIKNARLDYQASLYQKQEAFAEYFPRVSAMAIGFYAVNPMLEIGITDILGDNDFAWGVQQKAEELAGAYGFNTTYTAFKSGYSTSLSLMQPLYAGGRIVNGNKLASLGVQASDLQLKLQERKTDQQIEKDWWEIASLEDQIANLEHMDGTLETVYSQLKGAVASGLSAESDLYQVELSRNELKAGLKKARHGARLLKMNLLNTIGLDYDCVDSVLFVRSELEAGTPESYYRDPERIIANMEESKLLDLQVRAKKLEKKMSIGECLPQLALGGTAGYSDFYDKPRFNTIAFATVQIPLSDWGKTSRKAKRLDTEIQKAENERDYLGRQLRLMVDKLWMELDAAYDQWQLKQQSLDNSKKLYDYAAANYSAGLIPLQDLLQAESQYRKACTENADALIEYRNAIVAYTCLMK